jgi:hypothetical protein
MEQKQLIARGSHNIAHQSRSMSSRLIIRRFDFIRRENIQLVHLVPRGTQSLPSGYQMLAEEFPKEGIWVIVTDIDEHLYHHRDVLR